AYLRSLVRNYFGKTLSPKGFISHFHYLPSPLSPKDRSQAASAMVMWWSKDGWPDFAVSRFEKTRRDKVWISEVEVEQKGEIDFAPMIQITDEVKDVSRVRAEKKGDKWIAKIETADE